MQVINPGPSALGRLGEALGTGLSSGLTNLAQMKLQQLQQRQQQQHNQSALQSLNFNPEQAKALSPLSDTLLKDIIKQQLSAPSNNLYNQALASAVRGGDISQQPNAQQAATGATQSVNPSSNVADLIAQGNFKPQEAKQLADVELQRQNNRRAQEEQDFKHHQVLRPFLEKEADEYKRQLEMKDIAQNNYNILKKHAKKFPGLLVGNLPAVAQNMYISDPYVREYISNSNAILPYAASEQKGPVTKYKLTLQEMAKGNVGQPIKTQLNIWKKIIDKANKFGDRVQYTESHKNKETGHYPQDIQDRVKNYQLAIDRPLDYPQFYAENTRIINEEDDKEYALTNGEWRAV